VPRIDTDQQPVPDLGVFGECLEAGVEQCSRWLDKRSVSRLRQRSRPVEISEEWGTGRTYLSPKSE